uniref:Reverse transcriptase domain-containing protein n=1 Tax=Clytia hemisphaerica TaxID=252671 RepID=A0A7M5X226_9CNID
MVPGHRPFLPPSDPRLPAIVAKCAGNGTKGCVFDLPIAADFSMSASSVGPVTTQDSSASDSLLLDSFPSQSSLPTSVSSPVNISNLEFLLSGYSPDIVDFLIHGFSHGFRLGFGDSPLSHTGRNNSSAMIVGDKVSASIMKELERGHTAGPFATSPLPNLHCSPLGSAPKNDGSSRIILDLSQPNGCSVNDGIPIESCHVKYSSFDDAVDLVHLLGRGCFMGKIDIKHAFRLCPVHPDDWYLLGYYWRSRWYVDLRLPFGLRSSPFIFTTFSDALQWILVVKYNITALVHYLDDFFVVGRTKEECQSRMDLMVQVFDFLGVPIAKDKFEGPLQRIVFLGIEIDSVDFTIRLPADKKLSLLNTVESWLVRKKCTKLDLLSLIGSLSFACKVIKPGRIFLRRLINLSTSVAKLHHHISLS